MKGIRCEQAEKLALVELPEPACGPGEAIVAVKRIGICGTDLHAYKETSRSSTIRASSGMSCPA